MLIIFVYKFINHLKKNPSYTVVLRSSKIYAILVKISGLFDVHEQIPGLVSFF